MNPALGRSASRNTFDTLAKSTCQPNAGPQTTPATSRCRSVRRPARAAWKLTGWRRGRKRIFHGVASRTESGVHKFILCGRKPLLIVHALDAQMNSRLPTSRLVQQVRTSEGLRRKAGQARQAHLFLRTTRTAVLLQSRVSLRLPSPKYIVLRSRCGRTRGVGRRAGGKDAESARLAGTRVVR